jgi:hypothetical protein
MDGISPAHPQVETKAAKAGALEALREFNVNGRTLSADSPGFEVLERKRALQSLAAEFGAPRWNPGRPDVAEAIKTIRP